MRSASGSELEGGWIEKGKNKYNSECSHLQENSGADNSGSQRGHSRAIGKTGRDIYSIHKYNSDCFNRQEHSRTYNSFLGR